MAGYEITWDEASSSVIDGLIIQKVRRHTFGRVRDSLIDIPGRAGEELFTEERGNRGITASGVIIAAPEDRRAVIADQLAEWLDRSGYRPLIFNDQPDRYWQATLVDDPDPDEWKLTAKFDIQWSAQPYAFAISVSEECVTATDGGAETLSIPDTVTAYPVIEVTPLNGNMAGGFTLNFNDDSLTYAGSVGQGTTVTISSLNYTVTGTFNLDTELTGVYVPGTTFPADVSGSFPVLMEGDNDWSLAWDGTATLVRVCISWRRRYR